MCSCSTVASSSPTTAVLSCVVYDGRGRFQKQIGRRGVGPGEFGWLKLVPNWSSDSLVVFDYALHRISFINPSGEFGRSIQLPKLPVGTMLTASRDVLGVDREGRLLIESRAGASPDAPGMFRRVVTLTRVGPGATTLDVGTFKGNELLFKPVNGRPVFSTLPFLQQFVPAVGRDRLYYVEGPGSIVIEQVPGTLASQPRSIVFQAGKLSRKDFATWFEKELLTVPAAAREPTRRFYRELYSPWTTRPVSRMVVDDSGRIWIEEYSLSTSRRAAIYSPRFELLGIVPLPPAFTIHCVRGNLVAGVVTDADGVERVEVRPLIGL